MNQNSIENLTLDLYSQHNLSAHMIHERSYLNEVLYDLSKINGVMSFYDQNVLTLDRMNNTYISLSANECHEKCNDFFPSMLTFLEHFQLQNMNVQPFPGDYYLNTLHDSEKLVMLFTIGLFLDKYVSNVLNNVQNDNRLSSIPDNHMLFFESDYLDSARSLLKYSEHYGLNEDKVKTIIRTTYDGLTNFLNN